jgi:uncharacterized damage-inducible protein DinB
MTTPYYVLSAVLDDLADMLIRVSPQVYVARPAPGISGAVGEQVRHTLDHISAFLTAEPGGVLSYDRRQRGTAVETDLHAAIDETLRLRELAELESTRPLDEPIVVAAKISASSAAETWSTVGRELTFVLAHTIHHEAIIALLLAIQGVQVPPRFGYAPSTPIAADVALHAA